MSKKHLFLILFGFTVFSSFAQQKKADRTYEELGYKAAIPLFENKEDLSLEDRIKIANSYRLNHDVENAELWYGQVVQQSSESIYFLYYAQALHSNKKYDLAKEYYNKYQERIGEGGPDQRGAQLAEAIEKIHQFKHNNVTLKNESKINTSRLEFSPAYYQNGIVFVSTFDPKKRKKKKKVKEENMELDPWINDNFMTLYFAPKMEDNTLGEAAVFSTNISTKFHEGPVTFDKSGDRIFFSRNQYFKGKKRTDKNGVLKMNIYTAIKSGDDWSNVKEMPWNTEEYEEVHPTLSADGKRLYFASNRPGGFGGMDLYYSNFLGRNWGEPVNLGNKINTAGNEIFPFIHKDETLYFASDSWGGFGGLDIFSSNQLEDQQWIEPSNIGTPFNSTRDDFGFILNAEGTEGYLSSAREGGLGKDDIYSFTRKNNNQLIDNQVNATICVYNKKTNQRIEGVEIFIKKHKWGSRVAEEEDFSMRLVETEIDNEYLLKLTKDAGKVGADNWKKITDENGTITLGLSPNEDYLFIAKKGGYQIAQYPLQTNSLAIEKTVDFCIPLEKNYCMILEGKAINSKYESLIPNVKITLVNLCTGEEQSTFTDAKGSYNFPCLTCHCEFLIKGEKEYFITAKSEANTLGNGCENGGILKSNLMFILGKNEANNLIAIQEPNFSNSSTSESRKPIELAVGNVVELKKIYYDFDKYYIREGSAKALDWVVRLMKEYPSLVLELSSHTDSRGKNNYNKWLSRKRAKAAVSYITDRGIQAYRLQAKGAGEMELRNHCKEGVDCSEAEHQYNRRTEIRVLSFDRKDVMVNYIDNRPEVIDAAPLVKQR